MLFPVELFNELHRSEHRVFSYVTKRFCMYTQPSAKHEHDMTLFQHIHPPNIPSAPLMRFGDVEGSVQ